MLLLSVMMGVIVGVVVLVFIGGKLLSGSGMRQCVRILTLSLTEDYIAITTMGLEDFWSGNNEEELSNRHTPLGVME